jgi:hypothetical protein
MEFIPETGSMRDVHGKEILVGSVIRVSETGRDKLKKLLPKIHEDTPNFRCKVVRIADNKIFATPTEYGPDDFVEPSENEKVKISEYPFPFFPEDVIIE